MPFTITHHELPSSDVLHLKGRLVFGAANLALKTEVDKIAACGKTRLVLDFGEVSEIDATGCRTVFDIDDRLRRAGGGLALVNIDSERLDPVEVCHLETVLEPFDMEQEAANSFHTGRRIKRYDVLDLVRSWRDHARWAVRVDGSQTANGRTLTTAR
jgi:anti-anti-sigma factor